jgi:alpha-mannosidase
VQVVALKCTEDNKAYLLRLGETEGKATQVSVAFPSLPIQAIWSADLMENAHAPVSSSGVIRTKLQPWEVKTFRLVCTQS